LDRLRTASRPHIPKDRLGATDLTADRERPTLRCRNQPMIRSQTTRHMRPILWIAVVALLLAALGSRVSVTTCIGNCCAIEASSCCLQETNVATDHTCCSHCDEDAPGEESPSDDDTPLSDSPNECMPGCCLTMDFDIELAPINEPIELPLTFALALPPTTHLFAPMQAHEAGRLRPFDRGPPRVDQSTALRVCTVLLI